MALRQWLCEQCLIDINASADRLGSTVFFVAFRLQSENRNSTQDNDMPSKPYEGEPCRVLVVERNKDTRELFADLLAGIGYAVRTAETAAEALACVPSFRPNAVFSAIGLADQSGFELCAELRKIPETAAALIIAITGHLPPEHVQLSRDAGFDQYLIKPIQIETLLETMKLLDGYRGAAMSEVSTTLH
jgi:CheY-like chemotaxis protein